jgi:hypothetical protein
LLFEMSRPDRAFVGVEQVSLQCVQRLALVQLPGDLSAVRRIGEVAGGVDGAPQCPVLLECRGERILPAGCGQLADQQRGGGVSELQRSGQPE